VSLILAASVGASDPFGALGMSPAGSGTTMPAFSLTTLDGQVIRSKDQSGKIVLLNFWATWCAPCREEMPSLERLRRQFDPNTFTILAITVDRQQAAVKAFMRQQGLSFPTLLDEDGEVSRSFMVRALPATVLIGHDQKQIGRVVGPRAWDSPEAVALIRRLLARPNSPRDR
jgi:peroxiredoxin